jgi:hypothetical protein
LGRQFGKEERKKATLANSAKSNSEIKEVLKSMKKENKKLILIQMENENIYIYNNAIDKQNFQMNFKNFATLEYYPIGRIWSFSYALDSFKAHSPTHSEATKTRQASRLLSDVAHIKCIPTILKEKTATIQRSQSALEEFPLQLCYLILTISLFSQRIK